VEGVGACAEVRECVECLNFETDQNCSKCLFQTNTIERNVTSSIGVNDGVTVCSFTNSNKCTYSFTLSLSSQGIPLVNLISRNGKVELCGTPIYVGLGVGAGILVAIIGILTIIVYKCYIEINDRREYARFQKDLDMASTAVNQMPNEIYKSPITKFQNPTYGT